MSTITDRLARIMEAADAIAAHLAAMRETVSEEEWDALCDAPHTGALLMLAMDLEHEMTD